MQTMLLRRQRLLSHYLPGFLVEKLRGKSLMIMAGQAKFINQLFNISLSSERSQSEGVGLLDKLFVFCNGV
jgi:hypothetical protein